MRKSLKRAWERLFVSSDRLAIREWLTAKERAERVASLTVVCHPDTWESLQKADKSLRGIPEERVDATDDGRVAVGLSNVHLISVLSENPLMVSQKMAEPEASVFFNLQVRLIGAMTDEDSRPRQEVPEVVVLNK